MRTASPPERSEKRQKVEEDFDDFSDDVLPETSHSAPQTPTWDEIPTELKRQIFRSLLEDIAEDETAPRHAKIAKGILDWSLVSTDMRAVANMRDNPLAKRLMDLSSEIGETARHAVAKEVREASAGGRAMASPAEISENHSLLKMSDDAMTLVKFEQFSSILKHMGAPAFSATRSRLAQMPGDDFKKRIMSYLDIGVETYDSFAEKAINEVLRREYVQDEMVRFRVTPGSQRIEDAHPAKRAVLQLRVNDESIVERILLSGFRASMNEDTASDRSQPATPDIVLELADHLGGERYLRARKLMIVEGAATGMLTEQQPFSDYEKAYGPFLSRQALGLRVSKEVYRRVEDDDPMDDDRGEGRPTFSTGLTRVDHEATEFLREALLPELSPVDRLQPSALQLSERRMKELRPLVAARVAEQLVELRKTTLASIEETNPALARDALEQGFYRKIDRELDSEFGTSTDWKNPRVMDEIWREHVGEVADDESATALGCRDERFVERVKDRGLARLLQYSAISEPDARDAYGRDAVDRAMTHVFDD